MARSAGKTRFISLSAMQLIQVILLVSFLYGDIGYGAQKDSNLLDDVRIKAASIEYSGITEVEIFDKKYAGSLFSIAANVNVETVEGFPDLEEYEVVPAKFEIIVIEDKSKIIHNELVEKIYNTWSKKKLYSDDLYYFYFSLKADQYVLSIIPSGVEIAKYYFFWVNGRVFKITFKSFGQKSGLGPVSAFTSENLRIRLANSEMKAFQFPFSIPKHFLELYKEGFFKK
jgi:hypothetical protein